MGATLGSYDIAVSGLKVNERSLYVTGHNLANANVKGYTRQQAIIETFEYNNTNSKFQIGRGADIQQTRQIKDQFLDNIYRQENTSLGYWEGRNKVFGDIENILGDPMGEGLQKTMNEFWDSWQELSKDPSSLTVRAVVEQRGEALVNHLNEIGDKLDNLQVDLNKQLFDHINEVNDITAQIAGLNKEICSNEVTGDKANDLRDQRNLLVDRLSKLANIDVTEMQDKQLYISIGGYSVVDKGNNTKIVAAKSTAEPMFYEPMVEGLNVTLPVSSGLIKGLMSIRGDKYQAPGVSGGHNSPYTPTENISIRDIKEMLNDMVLNTAEEINKVHQQGYSLDGSVTNIPFFVTEGTGTMGMGNIQINPAIKNLDYIAAAKQPNASGDNTNALEISGLRRIPLIKNISGILSPDEFYSAIIMGVGNNSSEASNVSENQQKLVNSADANRTSIAGVSQDEEMSNMMKFQFAYGASSRVINVIDEMVDTIITRMGLVGR